ncbi:MAG: hypothetical protein IT317_03445 [Anaerolineales bacterium]|nr:hypothetical protein [Anaerolineales bacterium]
MAENGTPWGMIASRLTQPVTLMIVYVLRLYRSLSMRVKAQNTHGGQGAGQDEDHRTATASAAKIKA